MTSSVAPRECTPLYLRRLEDTPISLSRGPPESWRFFMSVEGKQEGQDMEQQYERGAMSFFRR